MIDLIVNAYQQAATLPAPELAHRLGLIPTLRQTEAEIVWAKMGFTVRGEHIRRPAYLRREIARAITDRKATADRVQMGREVRV